MIDLTHEEDACRSRRTDDYRRWRCHLERAKPGGPLSRLGDHGRCAGDDEERADRDLKAVREFGPPAVDMITRLPYPIMNTLIDGYFPRGLLNYWKSAFLTQLSDEAVGKWLRRSKKAPSTMCQLFVEHFHSVVTRVDLTATAFPHRHPGANFTIIAVDRSSPDRRRHRLGTRDIRPIATPHSRQRLRELPRRRRCQPDSRRLRIKLRSPCQHQAALRSGQSLPTDPEHRALTAVARLTPRQ